jgi:hypothetical protein
MASKELYKSIRHTIYLEDSSSDISYFFLAWKIKGFLY